MSHIEVKRPVVVKVVVTDSFKKQVAEESREAVKKIEAALSTLDVSNCPIGVPLEMEKDRLSRVKMELEAKMRDIDAVQNGMEIPYSVLEGPVTLEVGNNFLDRMTKAEVLIKDWVIVEIRHA